MLFLMSEVWVSKAWSVWGSEARANMNLFRRVFGDIVVGLWFSILWLRRICTFLTYLVVARR